MRYFLILVGCFVFAKGLTQAPHPHIPFEHLPIPGTINSSQVSTIVQDNYGLIWISGDGLFRYDGFKFTHYRQLSTGESIGGYEIKCIFNNVRENKLLVGTHSYGLVEYDYTTDQLRAIPAKGGIPIITSIEQTDDGTIWASSYSNGLYYLEADTIRKMEDAKFRFKTVTDLFAIGNKLYSDKSKKIYILEQKKLVDSISVEFPGVDFPASTRVTKMTADADGQIWMGTERAGVLVYNLSEKKFVKHYSPDNTPFFNRINDIMIDSKKNVWILTKANGVVICNPKTDEYIHITKNPLMEWSLSGNNCTSIIQDKTGVIWIGSTGDLNIYDPAKIKFRHIYSNPFNPVSLSDNMVRGVYEDHEGKLWVGTDGGFVHIFNKGKLALEKIQVKIESKSTAQHIVPVYFLELSPNIMLIGTSLGLLQYDRTKKVFSYFKPLETQTTNRQVRQLLKDEENLYFLYGGALGIYNFKSGLMKRFSEFGTNPAPVKNATSIYIDSQKRLWVGASNGLSLFNPESETFRHFPFELNASRPLGTYFMILSLQEYQNKLWVGTFNSGLWTMDLTNLDNPIIKGITTKDGLPNNTVYSTLPDDRGNLWISTNQGVAKYELANNKFTNFGSADGLQQEEFNRLAYWKCSTGEIALGGINGLNIFNPKNILIKEDDYEPTLLGVSAYSKKDNKNVFIGTLQQSSLSLKHNQNDLDFYFFIPNFRYPRRFEVFYKLSGFDPDWVKAETNSIHYSNLKPGEYPLEIKTVSNSGIEKISSFTLIIQYPFWQTWWFILLSTSVVSFMVFTMVKNSIQKARHDKERLEKLLTERTQEIEKSREQLANLNEKKDFIFSILSHDLRSPLTTLKGFLSLLIDDSDLSKEDVKRHASNIRNSVTSSLDLIDNTLFWSLSQTGNITYTPTTFSLDEMLLKISNLYQLTADKKQIKFSVAVNEPVKVFGDENMVYVTLRNLVSNALKFTPEGKSVKVSAVKNHQFAEITIQDEGIGMSPSYLERVLAEEHLPVKKGTSNEKGTGLGLILCKKFILMNSGELKVNSTEGKGTEFLLKLPIA